MLAWILFAAASIIYAAFSLLALRMAYRSGHVGGLTLPVSAVYAIASMAVWLLSALIFLWLRTSA